MNRLIRLRGQVWQGYDRKNFYEFETEEEAKHWKETGELLTFQEEEEELEDDGF